MPTVRLTRNDFLEDRQGKTFADVVNDSQQPFAEVLAFFRDADRQRRMEESELHHDRPPLAGVVRELESQPAIDRFLASVQARRNARFRQAIGVLVRMIMERRGWQKTGRKGSLGVRASAHGADAGPQYGRAGVLVHSGGALPANRRHAIPPRASTGAGTHGRQTTATAPASTIHPVQNNGKDKPGK